jgi:hypothetical protein
MKEVKLYDLLDLVITSNFDVGSIPEFVQADLLAGCEPFEPQCAGAFHCPLGLPG